MKYYLKSTGEEITSERAYKLRDNEKIVIQTVEQGIERDCLICENTFLTPENRPEDYCLECIKQVRALQNIIRA